PVRPHAPCAALCAHGSSAATLSGRLSAPIDRARESWPTPTGPLPLRSDEPQDQRRRSILARPRLLHLVVLTPLPFLDVSSAYGVDQPLGPSLDSVEQVTEAAVNEEAQQAT